MSLSGTVLIVDDDEVIVELYSAILDAAGYSRRLHCNDSRNVMGLLRSNDVTVVLLDLYMPHISGQELLEQIVREFPEVPVIILTLEDKIDVAVDCMKIGAFDFMTKPVDENRLVNSTAHAIRVHELQSEVRALSRTHGRADLSRPEVFEGIVSQSPAMLTVFAYIEAIADSPKSVLVTGESGTGKELVARAVHDASGRTGEFVAINVSGLDDTVFSDTLFGHRRGAFTGADGVRKGLIERAADGTLFLDEIGDLDNAAQVKLLRLLQDGEYYALGSDMPTKSTARVVAATNADLRGKQQDGSFRKDLYYRLMSHHVRIPALRERPGDLPLLLRHLVDESAALLGRESPSIPARLADVLAPYPFPGNVRELQSLVHDAMSRTSRDELAIETFIDYVEDHREESVLLASGNLRFGDPLPTLQDVEEVLFREALARTGGNQTAAARMIGVSQSTLSRRARRSD